MALTVLLGGERSGKSSLTVELGRRHDGPVSYVDVCGGGQGAPS